MRAAIYNPYWDTLGGGERYTISFAKTLIDSGYSVDMEWKDVGILKKLEDRFGIKTQGINIIDNIKKGDGYDVCFWVSDGSIPLLHSRNNYLHFQVPFVGVNGDSLFNKMKLFRIKKVICNSVFTKNIIDKEYKVNSMVLYPPCDTTKIKRKRKENIILSVGRFSQLMQSKHQDILIQVFKKLYKSGWKDWRLVLAGGIDVGADKFLKDLKRKSENFPIEFAVNVDYKSLVEYYGRSKIFWTASGFGENEKKEPKKVEHFGITLPEAMAAGCMVFAYKAGGHKEIIVDSQNGYLWDSTASLIRKMVKALKEKNSVLINNAMSDSKKYSYLNFEQKVKDLLQL